MTSSSGQDKHPQDTRAATAGKWWQRDDVAAEPGRALRGSPCPKCFMADLDWDSLFRLHCPNCGYVAECGAFT